MANKHKVSINQHSMFTATILIDGIPVQDVVRAYTVEAAYGQPMTMTVSLIPNGMTFESEAAVSVTPLTRDLLMRMGWTPPTPGLLPVATEGDMAERVDEPVYPVTRQDNGTLMVENGADEPVRKLQRQVREGRKADVLPMCGATRYRHGDPVGPGGVEECIAPAHIGDHAWRPVSERP